MKSYNNFCLTIQKSLTINFPFITETFNKQIEKNKDKYIIFL